MIEITPRDDAERAIWGAALDLAPILDGLPWSLVGARNHPLRRRRRPADDAETSDAAPKDALGAQTSR